MGSPTNRRRRSPLTPPRVTRLLLDGNRLEHGGDRPGAPHVSFPVVYNELRLLFFQSHQSKINYVKITLVTSICYCHTSIKFCSVFMVYKWQASIQVKHHLQQSLILHAILTIKLFIFAVSDYGSDSKPRRDLLNGKVWLTLYYKLHRCHPVPLKVFLCCLLPLWKSWWAVTLTIL